MFQRGQMARIYNPVKKKHESKRIRGIEDHRPVDGIREKNVIVLFEDNTWAFVWNVLPKTE